MTSSQVPQKRAFVTIVSDADSRNQKHLWNKTLRASPTPQGASFNTFMLTPSDPTRKRIHAQIKGY